MAADYEGGNSVLSICKKMPRLLQDMRPMAKIRGISSASRLATRLQHEGVGKVFPLTWALEDHDTPLEEKDKSMKTANFKNLGKFASTLSAIVLLSAVP